MPDQRLSDQRRPDQRHDRPEPYPAEKARGGEIILRKRWQRVVFLGALAIAVLIGFFLSLWAFGDKGQKRARDPGHPLPPAFSAMA